MKAEFERYLKSIGMTETFRERVETIYAFYAEICPDEITDIFVSEYIKEDKSREYENLWFFSSKHCMEAHNFVTTDNFDMDSMRNKVSTFTIEKRDYDFKKATEESRVHLKVNFPYTLRACEIKASKENCDYLKKILLKYFLPNFVE